MPSMVKNGKFLFIYETLNCVNLILKISAYLESMQSGKKLNVIVVDWGRLARSVVIYPFAVHHTKIVGQRVSEMIENLKHWGIVHLPNVHLVGFSLGSHVYKYYKNYILNIKICYLRSQDGRVK
jgi:hypothetical protein